MVNRAVDGPMMHPCFSRSGAGVLDRPGDGGCAGPKEVAQQGVGEGTALVEDRGQDPVGVGERLPGASAGSPESFAAASLTALFLPLRDLERCQLASQGVQLRAGHTGQLWSASRARCWASLAGLPRYALCWWPWWCPERGPGAG